MKSLIVAVLGATVAAGAASAQTAAFRCPASGSQFAYGAGATERFTTATGQDGTVCVYRSTSHGRTETLRVHWGLVGSVDSQGESFAGGLDLKALWPLAVGRKTTSTVTVVGRDGKSHTSTVTVAVAAYEPVTVPAGTFETFRVEESRVGSPARNVHWWAPTLATSVKESFPDWREPGRVVVLELTGVKLPAR